MVTIPRLVIAGTHSGVGKTTVAAGLMAALVKRGLAVQPFKVGPDYIDPTYHRAATGRVSRNLDTWLLTPARVRSVFQRAAAGSDLAVIEGVMGLFDGHSASADRGSTAEVAKLLKTPVILVVDGSRMARSAAALIRGYATFDPAVEIAGVIFNRVSERHFRLLDASLRRSTHRFALGYLPDDPTVTIPERQLGLLPAMDADRVGRIIGRLGERIAASVNLARVLRIARAATPLPAVPPTIIHRSPSPVVIGVARDEAFHFYYQDNLDLLEAFGARLVEFSPLRDRRLPDGLDGLYLGGGFPERFAQALERNGSLRRDVHRAVNAGLPTYAECGGLMYLAQRLVDDRGRAHAMTGTLPGTIRMTDRLQHFGYVTVIPRRPTILSAARDPIKGHEFHYSVWEHPVPLRQAAYIAVKQRTDTRREGFARQNLLASYIHVHFLTNPRWARGFVASAERWKNKEEG